MKNEISINIFFGPVGRCGFRTGNWKAKYKGEEFEFYASIPHQLSLDEQRDRLRELARSCLGFYPDADDVSPSDIRDVIKANAAPAVQEETEISTTQVLIALGKVIAGYRPGEEGWSKYDQQAYDVAMSTSQPLSESDIPAVQGEPVGWVSSLTDRHPRFVTDLNLRSIAEVDGGIEYYPVYAAPQPAEQPLSHDWDDQDKCRRCGDRDWYASADCSKNHLNNAVKRPQEWNGSGIPPVGTVCEFLRHEIFKPHWVKVRVVFVGKNLIALEHGASGYEFSVRIAEVSFRPIKTPEQIAAEERENVIAYMYNTVMTGAMDTTMQTGWQPIETAPRHEEILTLTKHGVLQGEWDGDVVRGYYSREMEWYATHWMPLPAPPEGCEP